MSIMSTIKSLTLAEIFKIKETTDDQTTPDLVKEINYARRDWQQALKEINYADSDLDGYVIYRINSTERRYMALLEQAKKEGMCAWQEPTQFCCRKEASPGADNRKKEPLCTG